MRNAAPAALTAAAALTLTACAAGPTHAGLRHELLQMQARDIEVREAAQKGDFSRWTAVDASNRKRLKEIVGQVGWPTVRMVGADGVDAAWLVAQHADADQAFQLRVLALIEPLVQSGDIALKEYAYLYDRTHVPQRWGTQGTCVTRTEWRPFEIEDVGHVEARRREAGMPTLRAYAALMTPGCANPTVILGDPHAHRRTIPVP